MRTAVGEFAGEEVFDEFDQLRFAQVIVGFDGVAADGGGDDVFAQTEFGTGGAGLLEFVDDVVNQLERVVGMDKLREGVNFEGPGTEGFDADSHFMEGGEVLCEPVGIAGTDLDIQWHQEALGRDAVFFHSPTQFLKEDPLMSGMLVDQHQTAGVFHENIEFSEHPEDFELWGGFGRLRGILGTLGGLGRMRGTWLSGFGIGAL